MSGLEIALAAVYVAGAAVTVWALVEIARTRAWRWLLAAVVLWPLGVIAWFVAGRRFYATGYQMTDR